MAQYPASSFNQKVLVTKSNTAGQKNISTSAIDQVSVTTVSGDFTAWTQYVASTTSELVLTGVSVTSSTSIGVTEYPLLQLGIGGAGSETSLIDIPIPVEGAARRFQIELPTPLRVASGSRVAFRIYDATSGSFGIFVQIFGVPYANLEGN